MHTVLQVLTQESITSRRVDVLWVSLELYNAYAPLTCLFDITSIRCRSIDSPVSPGPWAVSLSGVSFSILTGFKSGFCLELRSTEGPAWELQTGESS